MNITLHRLDLIAHFPLSLFSCVYIFHCRLGRLSLFTYHTKLLLLSTCVCLEREISRQQWEMNGKCMNMTLCCFDYIIKAHSRASTSSNCMLSLSRWKSVWLNCNLTIVAFPALLLQRGAMMSFPHLTHITDYTLMVHCIVWIYWNEIIDFGAALWEVCLSDTRSN